MSDAWASPEGIKARLDIASAMGQRSASDRTSAETALGETASAVHSSRPIGRAELREQALALLLWRPSFRGGNWHPSWLPDGVPEVSFGVAFALGAGVLCGFGFLPQAASAASARDPRFVVIVLRGAVDGLSAVPPVADPDYAALHGELAFAAAGDRAALPLDGSYGLIPRSPRSSASMTEAGACRPRGRDQLPRPVAFDGQDVLEAAPPAPAIPRAAG